MGLRKLQLVTWSEAVAGDTLRSERTGSVENGLNRRFTSRQF
jgi:hypothetical protein